MSYVLLIDCGRHSQGSLSQTEYDFAQTVFDSNGHRWSAVNISTVLGDTAIVLTHSLLRCHHPAPELRAPALFWTLTRYLDEQHTLQDITEFTYLLDSLHECLLVPLTQFLYLVDCLLVSRTLYGNDDCKPAHRECCKRIMFFSHCLQIRNIQDAGGLAEDICVILRHEPVHSFE